MSLSLQAWAKTRLFHKFFLHSLLAVPRLY